MQIMMNVYKVILDPYVGNPYVWGTVEAENRKDAFDNLAGLAQFKDATPVSSKHAVYNAGRIFLEGKEDLSAKQWFLEFLGLAQAYEAFQAGNSAPLNDWLHTNAAKGLDDAAKLRTHLKCQSWDAEGVAEASTCW